MSFRFVIASGFVNTNAPLTHVDHQVYLSVVADFLRCIEWEAQRQVLDMGAMTMEHTYGFLTHVG